MSLTMESKKQSQMGNCIKSKKASTQAKKYVSDLEVFTVQYPKAVFTMNSAFYYHGLMDTIPDCYYVKTTRGAAQIVDSNVKQIFELVRNRSKLPYDYYKEVIHSYRNIIHRLDIQAIEEYAYALPKTNMVLETLQTEVM